MDRIVRSRIAPRRALVKRKPKPIAKTFRAALERIPSRLGWTIIRIPFDVGKIWGTRGQLRVAGEINCFPFPTSLFPVGGGKHILLVYKRMRKGAAVRPEMETQFPL